MAGKLFYIVYSIIANVTKYIFVLTSNDTNKRYSNKQWFLSKLRSYVRHKKI